MLLLFAWIYLVCVLVRPQEYVSLLEGQPIMPVALLTAFASWLFADKNWQAPTFFPFAAFVCAAVLSRLGIGWFGGAYDWVVGFLPTCLLFLVITACSQSPKQLRFLLATIAIAAAVLALHGVQQANTGVGWTGTPLSAGRIVYLGIFNDPNDLGLLFLVALPIAWYFAQRSNILLKPVWLAASCMLLYGIYLTDSRGAMLGTVALIGLTLWRKRGLFVSIILGVPALVGLMLLPSRMSELSVSESSAFGRVDSWYEGLQMFLSSPLTGVGVGLFTDHHRLTAHNSFVLVMAETGILGYGTWITFVGYSVYVLYVVQGSSLRIRPVIGEDQPQVALAQQDRDLATVLLNCLIGFFFAAFFLSRSYIVVLYVLCAMATGHYMAARMRWPEIPNISLSRTWFRCIVLVLASIVIFYVIVRVLLGIA